MVKPGDSVGSKPDYSIERYFSEDHKLVIPEDFEERSNIMFYDFRQRLAAVVSVEKFVYFHNFSRVF